MHDPAVALEEQRLKKVQSADRKSDEDDYLATFGAEAVREKRFYNIGAGRFSHPVWTNVDFRHPAYEKLTVASDNFIEHDLAGEGSMPLQSSSACLFYTSHTIEHLRDSAVEVLLRESYRVLRPKGLIRIVCPDIELAYRAYLTNDLRYFTTFSQAAVKNGTLTMPATVKHIAFPTIAHAFLNHFARQVSKLEHLDGEPIRPLVARVFREKPFDDACDYFTDLCSDDVHARSPGDHINWFSFDKLKTLLTKAGFSSVWRSGYGQSTYAVLRNRRYFDRTRPCFSVYVEAAK